MTPEVREIVDFKLAAVRQELLELLNRLSEADWELPVYLDPEIWTVADTLRHLLQAEKSMVRLMKGISQGHPGTPEGFDLAAFNRKGIDLVRERPRPELLADLARAREETIAFMDTLTDADWEKSGRHAIGRVMSIYEICRLIGIHENGHLQDIRQAVEG